MKTKKATLSKRTPKTNKVVYITNPEGNSQVVRFTDVNKVHPALKDYFCYCLFKASNRIKSVLEGALLPFEIHGVHFAILTILDRSESPPPQNLLGDQMGIDKASMVKLIDYLEKRKLVSRVGDASDRRCKLLHITSQGRTLIAKAADAASKVEKKFMSSLSSEDQKAIKHIIPLLLQD